MLNSSTGDKVKQSAHEAIQSVDRLVDALHEYKYSIMDEFLGKYQTKESPPPGWSIARLGDLLPGKDDIVFGPHDMPDQGENVAVVTSESVATLRFLPNECIISRVKDADRVKYAVSGADIVMVGRGDSAGACAIMPIFYPGGILAPGCIRITIRVKHIEPFYFVGVLHYLYRRGDMKNLICGNEVDYSRLLEFKISFPAIEEQKKIANNLLSVSDRMVKAADARTLLSAVQDGLN